MTAAEDAVPVRPVDVAPIEPTLAGSPSTAFVLGGGALRGASQIGMLHALLGAGIRPDLVVGTSVGAINGSVVAHDPTPRGAACLESLWFAAIRQAARSPWFLRAAIGWRTASTANATAQLIVAAVANHFGPDARIEDLAIPLSVAATEVESSSEHWFRNGSLAHAILASSSFPGLLPALSHRGRHFLDGALVSPVPVLEAVRRGATTVFVLRAAGSDHALQPPSTVPEARRLSVEVARRYQYSRELAAVPADVVVHELPAPGAYPGPVAWTERRVASLVRERIDTAFDTAADYLIAVRAV